VVNNFRGKKFFIYFINIAMPNFTIYKSKRNGEKLSHEDFTYNKKREDGEVKIWRCINRKCQGYANTTGIEV
jgi:hypothetical protein